MNIYASQLDDIVKNLIKHCETNILDVIQTHVDLPSTLTKSTGTCTTYLTQNPAFLFKVIDVAAHVLLRLEYDPNDYMLLLPHFDGETISFFKSHSDTITKYLTQGGECLQSLKMDKGKKVLFSKIDPILNKILTKTLTDILHKYHGFEKFGNYSEDFRKYILLEHFVRKRKSKRRPKLTRRDLNLLNEIKKEWASFIIEKL